MTYLFLFSCLYFLLLVVLHWILCRVTGSERFVIKSLSLFLLSLFITVGYLRSYFDFLEIFVIYLTVLILWNSYLIFFINLQNSISFRILITIFDSSKQSLSKAEINSIYPDEVSLMDRLQSMRLNKFLELDFENQTIQITSKGKFFGKAFLLFRKLFGIQVFG
jgi:hypothetical protein